MSKLVFNQEKFYSELGALVRRGRIVQGLTQEQLAGLLSLNRTSITNIEKGKQRLLVHTLAEIAHYLHISLDELIPAKLESNKAFETKFMLPDESTAAEREFFESILSRTHGEK